MEHKKIWKMLIESDEADKLTAWILEQFQAEMADIHYTAYKEEADNARAYFAQLQGEFPSQVAELETRRNAQKRYAMVLGLQYGMFAGFKQFFVKDYTGFPFDELFEKTVNPNRGERIMQEFGDLRGDANVLSMDLTERMDDFSQEHLVSIEVEHEEQEHGIMRYAFMLGYHAAHEIICEADSPGAFLRISSKVWKTERELGFSSSLSERWT